MEGIFIIEVIPLAILPSSVPQLLSYFHDAQLRKGALVEILVGKRKIKAIVISSTPLEEQKGVLKKSIFQLKKISKVISEEPKVSDVQFKILLWLSKHYYTPLGLSLKTVFPSFLLNKKITIQNLAIDEKHNKKPGLIITTASNQGAKLLDWINRANGQVLMVVPDRVVLSYFQSVLGKYEPVIVHSSQGDKEKFRNWQMIRGGAKLVIGTRAALFYSFKNLGAVIVEDPINEMYKSDMTPKYDTPDLAEAVAQTYGASIFFTSSFAGVINYYKLKNNLIDISENKSEPTTKIKIIDTVNELKADNFSLLSRELRDELLTSIENGKKVLIFSPRKGYSGHLACQNCGELTKCPNCSIPMRVHKSIELVLICHRCSHSQQLPKFCSNCNSYKLKVAGPSGSQKIYDEIRELVSENHLKPTLLILDSDVVKNDTENDEVMKEIKKPGSAVLIATQMVFSHRYDVDFETIGVLNADALMAIPSYDTEERLLYHLNKLLDFRPDKLFIQTYSSDNAIYKTVVSGDYAGFYESELEMRKLFNYPPFCRLIKLSYGHFDERKASLAARVLVEKLRMAIAQDKLGGQFIILDASPAHVAREKNRYIYNVVIKVSPGALNSKDILKYVPADWSIEADPLRLI